MSNTIKKVYFQVLTGYSKKLNKQVIMSGAIYVNNQYYYFERNDIDIIDCINDTKELDNFLFVDSNELYLNRTNKDTNITYIKDDINIISLTLFKAIDDSIGMNGEVYFIGDFTPNQAILFKELLLYNIKLYDFNDKFISCDSILYTIECLKDEFYVNSLKEIIKKIFIENEYKPVIFNLCNWIKIIDFLTLKK